MMRDSQSKHHPHHCMLPLCSKAAAAAKCPLGNRACVMYSLIMAMRRCHFGPGGDDIYDVHMHEQQAVQRWKACL